MSNLAGQDVNELAGTAGPLTRAFGRPKWIAAACIIVLAALGWVYLAVVVAEQPGVAPGSGASWWPGAIDALCQPSFGHVHAASNIRSVTDIGLVWAMWSAMALAMMLPGAGPMIYTYAEIADTATRKGEPIVSPLVLTGGYAAVWIGFAAAATGAQALLARLAADPGLASAGTLFSGAIFIAAGAYQFSALKHACLKQCQQPFQFFFVNWATTPRGVFRLGLRQGLYCLGCCWAMMLLMFAVGTMNIVWMIVLGIVMTVEKMTTTLRLTTIIGVVLLAVGIALVADSLIAHWPVRAA